MMLVVLIGGIGLLVAGLVTVGLGIELELSFGNTLLLAGVIVACTGVLMLGLWIAVRELKAIARQFSGLPAPSRAAGPRPSAGLNAVLGDQAPEDDGFPFGRDQPAPEHAGHAEPAVPLPAPPWLEEATSRGRGEAPGPAPVEAPAVTRPRRNLLFSSSSKKERERAQARAAEPSRGRSASGCSRSCIARAGAGRTGCGAARDLRRRLAEVGTCPRRRRATATAWRPDAIDLCRCGGRRCRSGSRCAGRAKRGSAAGHGAQIRRRRWNGLFAVFRRFDRGADARRHDAVRIHRRAARPSRSASLIENGGGVLLRKIKRVVLVTSSVIRSNRTVVADSDSVLPPSDTVSAEIPGISDLEGFRQ